MLCIFSKVSQTLNGLVVEININIVKHSTALYQSKVFVLNCHQNLACFFSEYGTPPANLTLPLDGLSVNHDNNCQIVLVFEVIRHGIKLFFQFFYELTDNWSYCSSSERNGFKFSI